MNPFLELALDNPEAFAGLVLSMACLFVALLFCGAMAMQDWQDSRRHRARMARVRGRMARYRARY